MTALAVLAALHKPLAGPLALLKVWPLLVLQVGAATRVAAQLTVGSPWVLEQLQL